MKNITLRQLQIFYAVAKYRSFTAAADKLFLTQPTVSMQMKKMSALINQPLFQIINKRVLLTDVGNQLMPVCESVFKSLSDFEMTVSNMMGVMQGHLRISAVTTAEYFIPRILGEFCQCYPNVTVSLEISERTNILDRLREGVDDLYIIGQLEKGKDYDADFKEFSENHMVIFVNPDHPLVGQKNISIKSLSGEPFIMRENGTGTAMILRNLLKMKNLDIASKLYLGSNQAVKQAVIGKLGISMLSEYAIHHDVNRGDLVVLNVEGFPIIDYWHIGYPTGAKLSIVASVFLEFILNEGRVIMNRLRVSDEK